MTSHYVDITLRPDPEFSHAHLLGALIAKLHRALAQMQASDIGVSFPRYQLKPRSLGAVLRLHGSEDALNTLMALPWLQGIRDHAQIAEVAVVPPGAEHRLVQRRQFKTNVERLRRRRMRRKAETAEQAAAAIPDSVERQPDLPFVHLRSSSSGQPFCLFVELGPLQPISTPGPFNTYGLTQGGTVPWF